MVGNRYISVHCYDGGKTIPYYMKEHSQVFTSFQATDRIKLKVKAHMAKHPCINALDILHVGVGAQKVQ